MFHIHDNNGDGDSHNYSGTGIIDWADFRRALDDVGYDGVLSLETSPDGSLDDTRFAEESVALNRHFKQQMTQHRLA